MTRGQPRPATPPEAQPCVQFLPKAPPCPHATRGRPCCRDCARIWYKAMSRLADSLRVTMSADREAGR